MSTGPCSLGCSREESARWSDDSAAMTMVKAVMDVSDQGASPDDIIHITLQHLRDHGIVISFQWIEQAYRYLSGKGVLPDDKEKLAQKIYELYLNSDIYDVTEYCDHGVLPNDVCNMNGIKLDDSPKFLQIDEIVNLSSSQSAEDDAARNNSNGIMKLFLTDGKQRLIGLVFRPMRDMSLSISFGCKIVVRNAYVRRGVLILSSSNANVAGGEVERLMRFRIDKQATNTGDNGTTNVDAALQPLAVHPMVTTALTVNGYLSPNNRPGKIIQNSEPIASNAHSYNNNSNNNYNNNHSNNNQQTPFTVHNNQSKSNKSHKENNTNINYIKHNSKSNVTIAVPPEIKNKTLDSYWSNGSNNVSNVTTHKVYSTSFERDAGAYNGDSSNSNIGHNNDNNASNLLNNMNVDTNSGDAIQPEVVDLLDDDSDEDNLPITKVDAAFHNNYNDGGLIRKCDDYDDKYKFPSTQQEHAGFAADAFNDDSDFLFPTPPSFANQVFVVEDSS